MPSASSGSGRQVLCPLAARCMQPRSRTTLLTSRSRSRDFTGSSHNKPPGVCSPSRHVADADDQHSHRRDCRGDSRPRFAVVDARLRLVRVVDLLRIGSGRCLCEPDAAILSGLHSAAAGDAAPAHAAMERSACASTAPGAATVGSTAADAPRTGVAVDAVHPWEWLSLQSG